MVKNAKSFYVKESDKNGFSPKLNEFFTDFYRIPPPSFVVISLIVFHINLAYKQTSGRVWKHMTFEGTAVLLLSHGDVKLVGDGNRKLSVLHYGVDFAAEIGAVFWRANWIALVMVSSSSFFFKQHISFPRP